MSRISDQKEMVVWLYGLSGAGKTTISLLLKQRLEKEGFFAVCLDGDELRSGINKDLSFTENDREENIRRAAEIARLMLQNNIITICSFITPLQKHRILAAGIIGDSYAEIFIECPLDVCQARDVKGLYKKARANQITHFTGISSGFETPTNPKLIIHTAAESPAESMEKVYLYIVPLLKGI
ncbi:adenylyl-sulfate kinase [Mucilaginibacter lappiensis]|uniref:Adenylyl-sulfate kinase n=1 Tax=Mucilaginibacter lappiensis TaxID=354630 RepID=A0A841JKU4_9SPHI|nr:adenylyl-sulfate kinase [Mucilaginibacter lappiensis]MBB6130892.1 adenylyl-sulfate kinase [Mucilaginibacter lappiensis]